MAEKNPYFGATFAERKAARLGIEPTEEPTEAKAVDGQDDTVEDKAVAHKATSRKRRTSR